MKSSHGPSVGNPWSTIYMVCFPLCMVIVCLSVCLSHKITSLEKAKIMILLFPAESHMPCSLPGIRQSITYARVDGWMDRQTDGREVTQFMEDSIAKICINTIQGEREGREVTWLLSLDVAAPLAISKLLSPGPQGPGQSLFEAARVYSWNSASRALTPPTVRPCLPVSTKLTARGYSVRRAPGLWPPCFPPAWPLSTSVPLAPGGKQTA